MDNVYVDTPADQIAVNNINVQGVLIENNDYTLTNTGASSYCRTAYDRYYDQATYDSWTRLCWTAGYPLYENYSEGTNSSTLYVNSSWYTSDYYPIFTGNSLYNINCNSSIEPRVAKKLKIKNNLTIIVKSRAQNLNNIPNNEWTAMQTLRDMITEAEYRKYVKDGFISVLGQSGKIYQVYRNKAHIKVFLKGVLLEEICVYLKADTPPTDRVIAFKTMIETDEEAFVALGNRYNMRTAA